MSFSLDEFRQDKAASAWSKQIGVMARNFGKTAQTFVLSSTITPKMKRYSVTLKVPIKGTPLVEMDAGNDKTLDILNVGSAHVRLQTREAWAEILSEATKVQEAVSDFSRHIFGFELLRITVNFTQQSNQRPTYTCGFLADSECEHTHNLSSFLSNLPWRATMIRASFPGPGEKTHAYRVSEFLSVRAPDARRAIMLTGALMMTTAKQAERFFEEAPNDTWRKEDPALWENPLE